MAAGRLLSPPLGVVARTAPTRPCLRRCSWQAPPRRAVMRRRARQYHPAGAVAPTRVLPLSRRQAGRPWRAPCRVTTRPSRREGAVATTVVAVAIGVGRLRQGNCRAAAVTAVSGLIRQTMRVVGLLPVVTSLLPLTARPARPRRLSARPRRREDGSCDQTSGRPSSTGWHWSEMQQVAEVGRGGGAAAGKLPLQLRGRPSPRQPDRLYQRIRRCTGSPLPAMCA